MVVVVCGVTETVVFVDINNVGFLLLVVMVAGDVSGGWLVILLFLIDGVDSVSGVSGMKEDVITKQKCSEVCVRSRVCSGKLCSQNRKIKTNICFGVIDIECVLDSKGHQSKVRVCLCICECVCACSIMFRDAEEKKKCVKC